MTARKLPYFKFYPADFMGSGNVQMMTPAEVGVYIKLLCVSWQRGPLVDDPKRLARPAGASAEEMAECWPAVRECFTVGDDGRLFHPRLEKERADALDRSARASHAATSKQAQRSAPSTPLGTPSGSAGGSAPEGARDSAPGVPYSESQSLIEPESKESQETTRAAPVAFVEKSHALPAFTDAHLLDDADQILGLGLLTNEQKRTNKSILMGWLYKTDRLRDRTDIYSFIHGVADLRDCDMIGWLDKDTEKPLTAPGMPVTLAAGLSADTVAMVTDGTVLRPLWDIAVEHWRTHDVEPTRRGPRSKAMGRLQVPA